MLGRQDLTKITCMQHSGSICTKPYQDITINNRTSYYTMYIQIEFTENIKNRKSCETKHCCNYLDLMVYIAGMNTFNCRTLPIAKRQIIFLFK